MSQSAWLMVVAVLGAGEVPLPPNHPPLDGAAQRLPPVEAGDVLPPNHPPIGNDAAGARQVEPSPEGGAPRPPSDPELLQALEKLGDLSRAEHSFEVASGAGKLFFGRARYTEAAKFLAQAVEVGEPTRALFLKLRKRGVGLGAGAAGCPVAEGAHTLKSLHQKASELAARGENQVAAACAGAALGPWLETAELAASADILVRQPEEALRILDRALEVDPQRRSALYLRGMTRFDAHPDDAKALALAKKDLTAYAEQAAAQSQATLARAVLLRIDQALPEGGVSALDRKLAKERKATVEQGLPRSASTPSSAPGVAPLAPEVVQAVQATPRTPEMDASLDQLVEQGEAHLAQGQYQEALDVYKRVVPFRPESGRAKAGIAWALVGLGKPTADRVWGVAVQTDPAAVDRLGDLLRTKGDDKGAVALWRKLAESSPSYAAQAGLSLKLR